MTGEQLHELEIARVCRFVFGCGPAEELLRAYLLTDIKGARLSPGYRAYYRLRSKIPLAVRQLLQRYRRVRAEAGWYLPSAFVRDLEEAICNSSKDQALIHPWPDGANFAFVPTHDVESADGMRNIEWIANLEEELGFRSSWNFVPHKYPVDAGLLRDLQARGFEIGVHGYNHDGKLFASRSIFDRRVPAINSALRSFDSVGFRAPMVHRNLQWLQSLNVAYDASCFDMDPYQAMPGGIGSVWPFIAGKFVELPYTLPQDHTLFIAIGEQDGRIWEEKLEFISQLGGMALLITHPDYLTTDARINAYRGLLEQAREMAGMWGALPRQVAEWWRARDVTTAHYDGEGGWIVEGPAAKRARVAALRLVDRGRPQKLSWHELPGRSATFHPAEHAAAKPVTTI